MLTVTTLHYVHKHGDEITVHLSEDAALDQLQGLVLANWAELHCDKSTCGVPDCAGIPQDPGVIDRDTAIRNYFEHSAGQSWHTARHELPIIILITQDQPSEWAGEDLTAHDMARLGACIPQSSIPEAIAEIIFSWRSTELDTKAETELCDECETEIPVMDGGSLENHHHAKTCSLYAPNLR